LKKSKSYKSDRYYFEQRVEGEVYVLPDRAIFPIVITTKATNNHKTIEAAHSVFQEIASGSEALSAPTTAHIGRFRQEHKEKIVTKVFSKNSRYIQVTISLHLCTVLAEEGFWQRAKHVSLVQDFLQTTIAKYDGNDDISLAASEVQFAVNNHEQHRQQISESIYDKMKATLDVIAEKEEKKVVVKDVVMNPKIRCEVLNISHAALSMKLDFNIVFADKE